MGSRTAFSALGPVSGSDSGASGRPLDEWVRLVCAEYNEIPGLLLTRNQAQRLWGLDTATCAALLQALVDAGFLVRTSARAYVRSGGGG